ncbi:hypothetical protein ACX93W_01875 [Paenibacillus sp. CAU 1782]
MKPRTLTSPVHFHTAALDNTLVDVFQDGELLGSGHVIEVREGTVVLAGPEGVEYYVLETCVFVYAK